MVAVWASRQAGPQSRGRLMARGYVPVGDDWFPIQRKGWKMKCCSCSLVHAIDSRVNEHGQIELRIKWDVRATAAARRSLKKNVVIVDD